MENTELIKIARRLKPQRNHKSMGKSTIIRQSDYRLQNLTLSDLNYALGLPAPDPVLCFSDINGLEQPTPVADSETLPTVRPIQGSN